MKWEKAGEREVSVDLSWLFGLRRRGPVEMTLLWGQGYLRFSVNFSFSKSAVLKPSSDGETPARENTNEKECICC